MKILHTFCVLSLALSLIGLGGCGKSDDNHPATKLPFRITVIDGLETTVTEYSYDKQHRIKTIVTTETKTPPGVSPAPVITVKLNYDAQGNISVIEKPNSYTYQAESIKPVYINSTIIWLPYRGDTAILTVDANKQLTHMSSKRAPYVQYTYGYADGNMTTQSYLNSAMTQYNSWAMKYEYDTRKNPFTNCASFGWAMQYISTLEAIVGNKNNRTKSIVDANFNRYDETVYTYDADMFPITSVVTQYQEGAPIGIPPVTTTYEYKMQ